MDFTRVTRTWHEFTSCDLKKQEILEQLCQGLGSAPSWITCIVLTMESNHKFQWNNMNGTKKHTGVYLPYPNITMFQWAVQNHSIVPDPTQALCKKTRNTNELF